MTRRQILTAALSAPALLQGATNSSKAQLGGAPTAFSNRMRAARQQGQTFDILEHCHKLGMAGVEATLPASKDPAALRAFRQKAEGYDMRVILNAPLPKSQADVDSFDAAVKACKECGAFALHAALTPRRYEQFDDFASFKKSFEQNQLSVSLAEPVLRKNQIRLAVENHKGWRAAEQAAWLKRLGSEWVGVCLDFGNNLSLCETPEQTFQLLAPMTIFAHIKDMGVEMYPEGFLLSEVVFGEGVIPLAQTVATLREKDPNMLFCLEMITRDPLQIPVFTDKYWATFDNSYSPLPGRDLAKVLDLVRRNPPKTPLPKINGLSPAEQVKAEDDYNLKCVQYAKQHLNFA